MGRPDVLKMAARQLVWRESNGLAGATTKRSKPAAPEQRKRGQVMALEENFQAVCEFVGDALFEAHRGVIPLQGADFLLFGNDGYEKDKRSFREVEFVREFLKGRAKELTFTTTTDGYTWVMLVRASKAVIPTLDGRRSWHFLTARSGPAGQVSLWRFTGRKMRFSRKSKTLSLNE